MTHNKQVLKKETPYTYHIFKLIKILKIVFPLKCFFLQWPSTEQKQILNPEDCPSSKEIPYCPTQLPAVGGRESPQLGAKGPHTCSSPVGSELEANPMPSCVLLSQELCPIRNWLCILTPQCRGICWITTGITPLPLIIWEPLSYKNTVKSQETDYISNSFSIQGKIMQH